MITLVLEGNIPSSEELLKPVDPVALEAAKEGERTTRPLVPRRTGATAASLAARSEGRYASSLSIASSARWTEFGTRWVRPRRFMLRGLRAMRLALTRGLDEAGKKIEVIWRSKSA